MSKTPLFMFLIFVASSCATFSKNSIRGNLTEANLNSLDGTYNIIAINETNTFKKYWKYNNFFDLIDRKLIKDTLNLDTNSSYTFKLELKENKRLLIGYFKNGLKFNEIELTAKLKNDGYLYLNNQNVKPILIPYICGALDVNRLRFNIAKSKNLEIDYSHHRAGALFLIIGLDWNTWRGQKIYQLD